MIKLSVSLFLLISFAEIVAQSENRISVKLELNYGNQKLETEKWYKLNENDSILIENLKFYISDVQFYENDLFLFKENRSYHLIDASDTSSLSFKIDIPKKVSFDRVKFNLGIDSITNSGGVQAGDLDPTTGMYWTWQSGYINVKLEGKSNICNTRNNGFVFHLGGFSDKLNALQTIFLELKNQTDLILNVDIQKMILAIDLPKQNHIMSPSNEAVFLSKQIAETFTIK